MDASEAEMPQTHQFSHDTILENETQEQDESSLIPQEIHPSESTEPNQPISNHPMIT